MSKELLKKGFLQVLGLLCIAFGVSAVILSKLGAGSFDAFNTFTTIFVGLPIESVGTVTLVVNTSIAAILFLLTRQKKLFFSAVAGILIGFFINFAIFIYGFIFPVSADGKMLLNNIFFGTIYNIAMVFLVGVGTAILITQKLIMTPFDELSKYLTTKLKSYQLSKVTLDAFFLISAIILGVIVKRIWEQINFFTLISVFATGPVINLFIVLFNKNKTKGVENGN